MKLKFYKKALTLSLAITLAISPFSGCTTSTIDNSTSLSSSAAIVEIIKPTENTEVYIIQEPTLVIPSSTPTMETVPMIPDVKPELTIPSSFPTTESTPIIEEETIPIQDIIEEQIRNSRDIAELKDKKVIMLTFDDGPSPNTTLSFLDELSKRDAKVTFFVVGNLAIKYPDIIKRAYDEGHTVANHTYSHPELTKIDDQSILDELNKTNQLLTDILGIENRYTRPPYGSINKHVFDLLDQSFILWNVDPRDWQYRDADTVYQNIIKDISDGAIVVLHDVHATTIEGSLRAIDTLLAEGYAIISLEEAEQLGYINVVEKEKVYSLKK
jgi:Predicted xylanase/chitin deacetylase